MSLIDDIVYAATVISSTIPRVEIQDLLSRHRQELQSALDSLNQALRSRKPEGFNSSERNNISKPSSRPLPQAQQTDNSSAANHVGNHRTSHIQDHGPGASLASAGSQNQESPPVNPELGRPQHEQEDESDVDILMGKLKKEYEKIQSFTNKKVEDAISRQINWTTLDPRLVDIQLENRRRTLTQKFRGWLARYSFANDYLNWAEDQYHKPRDEFLILNAKDADNRGKGAKNHFKEFMISINQNNETTRKAIQYGLKYHSFEHTYGNRGVFAFLFSEFTAFRQLPYAQLQSLRESIHRIPRWSALAEAKAGWVSQCLLLYNEDCGKYRDMHGQKRQLDYAECPEQSRNKRAELDVDLASTVYGINEMAQNANLDNNHIPANPLENNESREYPTGEAESHRSYVDEGYDPFVVDFNFLFGELDDQIPNENLSAQQEQVGYHPDRYDPFEVDFVFLCNQLGDQNPQRAEGLQQNSPDQDSNNTNIFGDGGTGCYSSGYSSSTPLTAR